MSKKRLIFDLQYLVRVRVCVFGKKYRIKFGNVEMISLSLCREYNKNTICVYAIWYLI